MKTVAQSDRIDERRVAFGELDEDGSNVSLPKAQIGVEHVGYVAEELADVDVVEERARGRVLLQVPQTIHKHLEWFKKYTIFMLILFRHDQKRLRLILILNMLTSTITLVVLI